MMKNNPYIDPYIIWGTNKDTPDECPVFWIGRESDEDGLCQNVVQFGPEFFSLEDAQFALESLINKE